MTTDSEQRAGTGKRVLDRAALDRLLASAGMAPATVRSHTPLPGGTYNSLFRLALADGTALLLKLPPDPARPALRYERGLLHGEATFYRAAAEQARVPVPDVVHADPGGGFLLMTECPGTTWDLAAPADEAGSREELGRLVARLHHVTGPRFGYPADPLHDPGSPEGAYGAAPSADWRGAFTAMLAALFDDAERFGARLPLPLDGIRALTTAAAPALAEVTTPTLVHFDLWPGNILLDAGRIAALIDGERMFWGDPLAELTSLNLFGGPEDDPALLAGYRAGGGRTRFDDAARLRMALYRAYLYLIMLTELHPRGYPPEHVAGTEAHSTPALTAALAEIAAITGVAPPR